MLKTLVLLTLQLLLYLPLGCYLSVLLQFLYFSFLLMLLCLDHLLDLSSLDLLLLFLKVELFLVLSFLFLGPVSFTSNLLIIQFLLSNDVFSGLLLHGSVSVDCCIFLLLFHCISHFLVILGQLVSFSLSKNIVSSLPRFIYLLMSLVLL